MTSVIVHEVIVIDFADFQRKSNSNSWPIFDKTDHSVSLPENSDGKTYSFERNG